MKNKPLVGLDLVRQLRKAPLFHMLDDTALSRLAQGARLQHMPKGEYIFLQSDPGQCVYIVHSGVVAILINSPDGRELVINQMEPGDCFGELALITQQTRSTTALARQDCEIICISPVDFKYVLHHEPALALSLLEIIAERLASSSVREGALAFMDAQARLVRVLLQLDRRSGTKGYVKISQEELARFTGLTRQTVAKILGRWRADKWLITGRGYIMFLQPEKMQALEEIVGENS